MLRTILAATALLLLTATARHSSALPTVASDEVAAPHSPRYVVSPGATFTLQLDVIEAGDAPKVAGTLRSRSGEAIWLAELPQYYGPRYAFVADDGRVLLLDEWVPSLSRYAVMALAPDGSVSAMVGYENLAAILRMPPRDLMASATHGPWLMAEPQQAKGIVEASTPAGTVRIDFAGRVVLQAQD